MCAGEGLLKRKSENVKSIITSRARIFVSACKTNEGAG